MQCLNVENITFSDGPHVEVGEMLLWKIPQKKSWQRGNKHKAYGHFSFPLLRVCRFLGMVKRQKQSRVIIFPRKRSNCTYKHGSSRSDFRPVALEKLDDWDVIKVQHARKVLNLRVRKAPNSRNQLDDIIHCDLGGGWFHWSCINNNTLPKK